MGKMYRFAMAGAIVAAIGLAPSAAHAQTPDVLAVPASASAAPLQQISANPFLIVFKYFNVEYERRATDASTWGVSTSFLPMGHSREYRNVGGFWHYYPGHRPLRGFFLGGRLQAHHFSGDGESGTIAGAGFELGYNWIVGRRTLVGIGFGATRLFGGALDGESLAIPSVRLANVGITF